MISVIGAGIAGLSSAAALRAAGHDVRIVAETLPPGTTSNCAGAIWLPTGPEDSPPFQRWAEHTLRAFDAEVSDGRGVCRREVTLLDEPAEPAPWWARIVSGFRALSVAELPIGAARGITFRTVVVAPDRYLDGLRVRLLADGVTFEHARTSIEREIERAEIIVNCTGVDAREIAGDPAVQPVRGQVVRVAAIPGVERVIARDEPGSLTYVMPRVDDILLGGTREPGQGRCAPDPAVTESILARCRALEPRLAGCRVLDVRVGARPGRPTVRVEAETRGAALVVHNYGHGGSGWTLSHGCAAEVARLVREAVGARA